MLIVEDIESSLRRGAIFELEDAFESLVDYPREDEIDGVRDADHLYILLMLVSAALDGDQSIMPNDTVDAIIDMAGDKKALADHTYSSGAAVVTKFGERWLALFLRHV